MTAEAGPVSGNAPVTDLMMRARDGDQQAWDAIVERYALLVWSICRRYRLDPPAWRNEPGQARTPQRPLPTQPQTPATPRPPPAKSRCRPARTRPHSALGTHRESTPRRNQDCVDPGAVHVYAQPSMAIRENNALLSAESGVGANGGQARCRTQITRSGALRAVTLATGLPHLSADIAHCSRPTVTLRHVVRSPLGQPRPSLPEAFSSIWPYGQVVTSYLRKGHL
jgi:hypothetical protein